MSDLDAKVATSYELSGRAVGADGYTASFRVDDSLRSWWAIVRWNIHFRHWRTLLHHNIPDLFRKVKRL